MTPPSPPGRTAIHFWPRPQGEPAPLSAVFPCGTSYFPAPTHTNNPGDVTCRRCLRSFLVQGLLRHGRTFVVLDVAGLELWNLLRR